MKRFIIWMIASIMLISTYAPLYAEGVKLHAKGAVLVEQDSGRILYDKNAKRPLPMASTTKIMTCVLALEKGNLNDVVTASKKASRAPKVKLGLQEGEKQLLGDLLYSLMLESHNDTAVAIAEHIGGSVEHFCEMMTQKAREIGAVNTSFQTPNGLDAKEHYASPYDLALIGAYALKNPQFVEIITTPNKTIPSKEVEKSRRHDLQNKNRFLSSYQGANGIKTGFTSQAGHCFVGAAKQKDMQLIGVALGSGWGKNGRNQKYQDVITLMRYGFKNYDKYPVVEPKKQIEKITLKKGKKDYITIECKDKVSIPLTIEEKQHLVLKKTLPTTLKAPITKGMKIGKLEVMCNNQVLATVPLYAEQTIEKATLFDYLRKWLQ